MDRAFCIFDSDGNGFVSRAELKRVFEGGSLTTGHSEELWDAIIEEVDKDNDGMISREEFKSCMISVITRKAELEAMQTSD